MSAFVLVHGAWHGSWCWERVVPLLEAQGHTVFAPDLPGHGAHAADIRTISLDSYSVWVADIISQSPEPVVLVGHSMAGMVISQVAERYPQSIAHLVFVSAFVPQNGDTLLEMAMRDGASLPTSVMQFRDELGHIELDIAPAADFFYSHTGADERAYAFERLCHQPMQPFVDPVMLSAPRFGGVPKSYILCENDKVICPDWQLKMADSGQMPVASRLPSDHSPFFCAPDLLCAELIKLAGSVEMPAAMPA